MGPTSRLLYRNKEFFDEQSTRREIVLLVAIALCLLVSSALATITYGNASQQYPVNESGLSYGSAAQAVSVETEPDLILAEGTNGKVGYVYSKDLNGETPKSPEEAVQMTKALEQK